MKPNTLRCLGMTAAAAGAVWCWYLLRMEPDSIPKTAGKRLAPVTQVAGNEAAVRPSLPWPKYGTDEFHRTLVERGQQWLDVRGRDAEGLIILFDLTHTDELLDEAREKFPDDPGVCRAWVQQGIRPAKPWIERLLAAEPNNPDAHYLKAWTLMMESWEFLGADRAGAIAALRIASAFPGHRNDHVAERMRAVHATAIVLGIGPGDAVRMTLDGNIGHSATHQMISQIMTALTEERAEAKAAGNEARFKGLTKLGLRTLDEFVIGPAAGHVIEWAVANQRMALLAEVPEDTELEAFSGRPDVGFVTQANEARLKTLEEFGHKREDIAHLLETASDEVLCSYFDQYMLAGWRWADPWLLEQAGKAK